MDSRWDSSPHDVPRSSAPLPRHTCHVQIHPLLFFILARLRVKVAGYIALRPAPIVLLMHPEMVREIVLPSKLFRTPGTPERLFLRMRADVTTQVLQAAEGSAAGAVRARVHAGFADAVDRA